jgi:hypothetical protein
MFGQSKKVIVVSAEYDGYGYDQDNTPTVSTKEYSSIPELLKDLGSELGFGPVVDTLMENEFLSNALEAGGWRHIETIKDQSEKVIAEKQFFIFNNDGFPQLQKVNLATLSEHQIRLLASHKGWLVQMLSKDSLREINPEAHKKVQAEIARVNKIQRGVRKANLAKKEKNKQKEIENAQKLLKEAGLLKG